MPATPPRDPRCFSWLPPRPWTCPGCGTMIQTAEAAPRCPRCGFREGT
jgi:rubrerythrin